MGLCFVPFPGLSNSGDQVFGECGRCDSGDQVFGECGRCDSGDQVFGERGRCDLSLPLSLLLGFLGVQPARLLR